MTDIIVKDIDTIVFDFDGVLTDNSVFLNEHGEEFVRCNRSDGLGFDTLKKIGLNALILSTEKNKVVSARGKKLNVKVLQGIENKQKTLTELSLSGELNLKRTLYVGNDLNDYHAIKLCQYSACPADSDVEIKKIVNFVLDSKGGEGVVKELLQIILKVDIIHALYKDL